ncbi:divalent-cation tolerance protein CutA [[Limnothrix rosea] IAM M-220]|uniref:divalent-cation tolerance protein CutA n=1 Tax=[Limnothrix rosea] IAM M-220 TaxID=454133 RepID=UPI00096649EF|nr:divalent-cation tolerance protein CutA [[Limnothrix rosea] IAM M-220]OKH17508.1 cytochrome C biogenesis protein [[Limnothrix rosea] IAM M-220]
MVENQAIAVVTTTETLAEAQRIAEALVAEKLIACAQIKPIDSIYRWQGEVQNSSEFQIVCKTIASNYQAIEAAIVANHSYELPEIYGIALTHGYEPYLNWIAANSNNVPSGKDAETEGRGDRE